MRIGYARVSTQDQDTQAQITALKVAGCELLFQEKASGGRWDRPELQRLLGQLRKGDIVVVWKLDRLSRSLKDVLVTLERIEEAGADFHSLTEAIDTTTPAGRMMMQMVGSFAEFERAMLRERTPIGNMSQFTLEYLIGELLRRTGNLDQALSYMGKVAGDPLAKNEYKIWKMAKESWQQIREAKKKLLEAEKDAAE